MKIEQWTLGLAATGVIEFGAIADTATVNDLPDELRPLAHRIQSELPRAQLKIDAPADRGKGVWYLDLTSRGRTHVIGWQKGKPFGFAHGAISHQNLYGAGWPETFPTVEGLLARLAHL